jgi:signal recognition particle GTPase
MFNLLKRKKSVTEETPVQAATPAEKQGFFKRLKQGLSKTSTHFSSGIANLVLGKKILDGDVIDLIEAQLITAGYFCNRNPHQKFDAKIKAQ